jgi:hypothetical protein
MPGHEAEVNATKSNEIGRSFMFTTIRGVWSFEAECFIFTKLLKCVG